MLVGEHLNTAARAYTSRSTHTLFRLRQSDGGGFETQTTEVSVESGDIAFTAIDSPENLFQRN